jgi:methyl-accepting chemotaxis protein
VVMVAVFLALLLGVVASTTLTSRLLGPLRVVNAAVRRFGGGDLAARAIVQGRTRSRPWPWNSTGWPRSWSAIAPARSRN